MKPGSGVVWAIYVGFAVIAWQTGVLIPVLLVSLGFVMGVAATWLYARIRIGGN